MKKFLLALSLYLALIAPWRLMGLGVEALTMRPGNVRTAPGSDAYWQVQDLESRLRRFGWKVDYVAGFIKNEGAYGATFPSQRQIIIDDSLSWNERFSVLAHEAAHTLAPFRLTQQQGEVFAESVAYLLAHDGVTEHARYLASLKPDVLPVYLFHWRDIYRAVDILQE